MTGVVRYVALFRGINVGRGKPLAMAELRLALEGMGFRDVAAILRSGSAVFSSAARPLGEDIEEAVLGRTGVRSAVIVLSGAEFAEIAMANPLLDSIADGSKGFVTFADDPVSGIRLPDPAPLAPELIALGDRAVYQWMPEGNMRTRVPRSFWTQFTGTLTARNQNTVEKVLALLRE